MNDPPASRRVPPMITVLPESARCNGGQRTQIKRERLHAIWAL